MKEKYLRNAYFYIKFFMEFYLLLFFFLYFDFYIGLLILYSFIYFFDGIRTQLLKENLLSGKLTNIVVFEAFFCDFFDHPF